MAVVVLSIPYFTITELIYPVKRDSVFFRAVQLDYEQRVREGSRDPGKFFLYHPRQLKLDVTDLEIAMNDRVLLKAWYVRDSAWSPETTVIIIPDLNESRIDNIIAASELSSRGFNVCLPDMRGQGASGGKFYTLGELAVQDLLYVMDMLRKSFNTENFILMGNGTGASIAMQTCIADTAVKIAVIQNSFLNISQYVHDYAQSKYGIAGKFFLNRMIKKLERETGIRADSLNLAETVQQLTDPALFISYISEQFLDYKSTEKLYTSCASLRKEWIVFKKEYTEQNAEERKKYFDRIAAFCNSHLPKKIRKPSKFRKLV